MKIVLPDCSVLRSNACGSIAVDIRNLPENLRELDAGTVRRIIGPDVRAGQTVISSDEQAKVASPLFEGKEQRNCSDRDHVFFAPGGVCGNKSAKI